jgi:aminoglycoside phosphotransferase (APT) family kinase protein/GNAT superfamily N-acetyltransferase
MTFKNNWEKTDQQLQIPGYIIRAMVESALPTKKLASYEVISGGCANLNIKINLVTESNPFILRIYVRDKGAVYREQKLSQLLKKGVPLPNVYFIGDYERHRYAITEYIPGISLRDFLLNHPHESMQNIMIEAGQILSTIQSHEFPIAGFFDADLKVNQPTSRQDYLTFAKECLIHPTVMAQIGKEKIAKIEGLLNRYGLLFPGEDQTHLVHGDYDPANILIDKIDGQWKITGVLDWEFAHSGSTLCDVANMLRYAHHMPPIFKESFLQGLLQGGVTLPENWRISVHLLNLLSLLQILMRCPAKERPNQCADICELMSHIISSLEETLCDVRFLRQSDIPLIAAAFAEIGWDKPASLYQKYLKEQEANKRCVWVAFKDDVFAGYVTLKWESEYVSFNKKGIPEISDLNVLPQFRKQGIAWQLLERAEAEAQKKSTTVGIGVGLSAEYGEAQKLYVKRGYIPDGKGITHDYEKVVFGRMVPLDDDLVLWLTKVLTSEEIPEP